MTFEQFEQELLNIVGVGFEVVVHSKFHDKQIIVKFEHNAIYIGRSLTMFSAYYDVFLNMQRCNDLENCDFSSLGKYFDYFKVSAMPKTTPCTACGA